jgi:hypothetical protein
MAAGTHDSDDGDDAPLAERFRSGARAHGAGASAADNDAVRDDTIDPTDPMDDDELDAVDRLMGFLRSDD